MLFADFPLPNQLMLPGLEMNYLNALMFYINVYLMSVQLFVIIISLFYQRLKNPQSEIHSQNTWNTWNPQPEYLKDAMIKFKFS